MVKLSDLLLINHRTDWAQTGVTSFSRQFMFMASSITYSIIALTIDGVKSFLELHDVQKIRKNTRFSLNKSCRKF